jgi:thermopsin
MWGLTQTGFPMYTYSGTVNPPNSFMFASPDSPFNQTLASWIPLSNTGQYSFTIPFGELSSTVMLSDYSPANSTLRPGNNGATSLTQDYMMGVYTPLYAMDNAQLKYISYFGNGQRYSPYVIYNNAPQSSYLNPLFNELNDYAFPAFSGLLLHDVSAYTVVSNEPSFAVNYANNAFSYAITSYYGLPSTNDLGMVLYQTSNALVYGNQITGWFSYELTEFPVANLLLWNSQNNVIMYNQFTTLDSSMLIYNTHTQHGKNYVLDNMFIQSSQLNATNYKVINVSTTFGTSPAGPVALTMYSSGNVVSGNYFIVYNTAISPDYSIYSGLAVHYKDQWNGNFWWNYTPRTGAYNNFGLITSGYDAHPITYSGYQPSDLAPLVDDFLS